MASRGLDPNVPDKPGAAGSPNPVFGVDAGRDAVEVVDILARNVCTDTLDKMAYVVVGHGMIGKGCGGSMVNVYNV